MTIELRPVVRRLARRHVHDVVARPLGVGPEVAAEATGRLLEATEVDHVVVVGVAGAVDAGLHIADVVVPEVVVDGRDGSRHHPAPLPGTTGAGTLLTTEGLFTGGDVLAAHRRDGVTAVDMETAAVAAVCERLGVRWSVVRAISDRLADETVVDGDLALLRPDGRADLGAVCRVVVRRPRTVLRLARLGRDTSRAAAAAAAAAVDAVAAR
jgi:adenosylhomocysteine nucleosidase